MDGADLFKGEGGILTGTLTEASTCGPLTEDEFKDSMNAMSVRSGFSPPFPERPSRTEKEALRRRATFRLIRGGLADE